MIHENIILVGNDTVLTYVNYKAIILLKEIKPVEKVEQIKPKLNEYLIEAQSNVQPYVKQFICKGKHQYRETRLKKGNMILSIWTCQCGRKTND